MICTSEMYFWKDNSPPQAEKFGVFSFQNAFSVKGFESFRGPNPQNFPPAAGYSPPGGGGKTSFPPQGSGSWGGKKLLSPPPRGPDPGGVKILGFSFTPPSGGVKAPLPIAYTATPRNPSNFRNRQQEGEPHVRSRQNRS